MLQYSAAAVMISYLLMWTATGVVTVYLHVGCHEVITPMRQLPRSLISCHDCRTFVSSAKALYMTICGMN